MVFASPVKIEKPVTSIWLEKKNFPTGIAQFTIFNNNGEPLNERIAFIRSNDQLQLDLKTVKGSYRSKERINVNLDAKDSKRRPTFGNFSVAVIDETKIPFDENKESTIFSNLLLTSDLKGFVEKPNYYFINETDNVNKALDNLMLTQGYSRFTWKQLNSLTSAKPKFPAEGLLTTISGKITTLNGKALINAVVNLISVKAKVAKTTSSDAEGRFKFEGIFMTDSIKFVVQASKDKTKNIRITLDSIPHLPMTANQNLGDISTNINGVLKTYIDNGKKLDDLYEKAGRLDQVHRLREINIRERKTKPQYVTQGMYHIPEGHTDQTYIIHDPTKYPDLSQEFAMGLRFVFFRENWPYTVYNGGIVPMQIILDGRKLDRQEADLILKDNYIDMESILKIEVVRSVGALIMTLGGPSILIYTKKDYVRKYYNPGILNITPKGFNKVREFYLPRYARTGDKVELPDQRTTVYWNPNVKTDTDGKTSFSFYNADGPGIYKVIVEGINADGELGRQVYKYTVD